MKALICNDHPSAVRLREAALAFAKYAATEPEDDEDKKGMRLNRALLTAALEYATAVIERTNGVTGAGSPTSENPQ